MNKNIILKDQTKVPLIITKINQSPYNCPILLIWLKYPKDSVFSPTDNHGLRITRTLMRSEQKLFLQQFIIYVFKWGP